MQALASIKMGKGLGIFFDKPPVVLAGKSFQHKGTHNYTFIQIEERLHLEVGIKH